MDELEIKIADIYSEEYIIIDKIYDVYTSESKYNLEAYNLGDPTLASFYYETVCLTEKDLPKNYIEYIDEFVTNVNKVIYLKSIIKHNRETNYSNEDFYEVVQKLCFEVLEESRQIKYELRSGIDEQQTISGFKHIEGKNSEWTNYINAVLSSINESEANIKLLNAPMKNCVAVAYPVRRKIRNSTNSYFALSGTKKDYVGTMASSEYGQSMAYEYRVISSLLKRIYGYQFIECHLDDNVNRYTQIGKNDGLVLNYPVSFGRDYALNRKHSHFLREYSCCEKKIIAKMGFVNLDYYNLLTGKTPINKLSAYIFLIRKIPCEKCLPALIGCYNIRSLEMGLGSNYEIKFSDSSNNTPLVCVKM